MVLTFPTDILHAVWVAHSEDMSSLSSTSTKYFLTINRTLSSKESMDTKTFSFLKFCEHTGELSFLKLRDYIKMVKDVKGKTKLRRRTSQFSSSEAKKREKNVYKKMPKRHFFRILLKHFSSKE